MTNEYESCYSSWQELSPRSAVSDPWALNLIYVCLLNMHRANSMLSIYTWLLVGTWLFVCAKLLLHLQTTSEWWSSHGHKHFVCVFQNLATKIEQTVLVLKYVMLKKAITFTEITAVHKREKTEDMCWTLTACRYWSGTTTIGPA